MEDVKNLLHQFNTGDVLLAYQLNDIVTVISTLVDKIKELETKINELTAE